MIVNCVLPTCRPLFISSQIDRIRSQVGCDVRVIVVENGEARGACDQMNLDADVVLSSADSAPAARNVGLAWVKRNAPGLVSFFDDDDIYLSKHLSVLLDEFADAPAGSVVGRTSHYLRTVDDRLLLLEMAGSSYVLVQSMLLHSDAGDSWNESLPVEEVDVAWCHNKKIVAASPQHFAFHNGPWEHLWAPPDSEWPCRVQRVFDLGEYDPHVVAGISQPPQHVQINPTFEALNAMVDRLRARKESGRY